MLSLSFNIFILLLLPTLYIDNIQIYPTLLYVFFMMEWLFLEIVNK